MKVKVMHGVDNGVNIPNGGAKAASEITCAASSAAIYLKGRTMDFEIDVSSAPPDEPRGISLAESPDGNLGLTICDGEHYVAIVLCERIVLSETLAALANAAQETEQKLSTEKNGCAGASGPLSKPETARARAQYLAWMIEID